MFRENHIELSDGDTYIVSNKKCPLSDEQANELNIVVPLEEDSTKDTICCKCIGWIIDAINVTCPHYYGVIATDKGLEYDCALLEPRKSMNQKK